MRYEGTLVRLKEAKGFHYIARVLRHPGHPFHCRDLAGAAASVDSGCETVELGTVVFPASFQLIAAMNPCPCGWLGDSTDTCRCSLPSVVRYRARVSGALLDRIDLHVNVPRVPVGSLAGDGEPSEPSSAARARVVAARSRQLSTRGRLNAYLPGREVRRRFRPGQAGRRLLDSASERLGLSARAYTCILRVARTIADLAGTDELATTHLAEAIQYRTLDRNLPR